MYYAESERARNVTGFNRPALSSHNKAKYQIFSSP